MESQEMSSGQPEEQTSGQSGDTQQVSSGNGSVKYETYKKVLGEKKAADARLRELEQKVESFEVQTMQEGGQLKELVEKLQKQNQTYASQIKEKEHKYAHATLSSQIKTEAVRMGCLDPDRLLKLMDLSAVPVDPETYTTDNDGIRLLLEEQKKTLPFFFSKAAPTVHDVSGANTVPQESTVDFSSMSRTELAEFVKKNKSKF